MTVTVAALVGVPTGLIAGYYGGWFDTVAAWLAGLLMALPALVVLLAVRAVVGPSLWLVMAIFGVLISPAFYRVVSGAVRAVRKSFTSTRQRWPASATPASSDATSSRPCAHPRSCSSQASSGLVSASRRSSTSSGWLHVPPTWGGMLSEGFYNIFRAPSLMVWPSLAIALTCIALTLLGTALRDEMEFAGVAADAPAEHGQPVGADRPAAPVRHDVAGAEVEPLLHIRGLAVAYPKDGGWTTVVDGVDLVVMPSKFTPSSANPDPGKTQTAWATLGLLPAGGRIVAGSITFDARRSPARRFRTLRSLRGRRIAYVLKNL